MENKIIRSQKLRHIGLQRKLQIGVCGLNSSCPGFVHQNPCHDCGYFSVVENRGSSTKPVSSWHFLHQRKRISLYESRLFWDLHCIGQSRHDHDIRRHGFQMILERAPVLPRIQCRILLHAKENESILGQPEHLC